MKFLHENVGFEADDVSVMTSTEPNPNVSVGLPVAVVNDDWLN